MKRTWTKRYLPLSLCSLLIFLSSCASGPKYPVESDWGQHGLASWYGQEEHGNHTANGEIFNKNALTAAHRTLPFGTYVQVTNLQNNRTVVVKINDRGPFVRGRVIDLSYAAAKQIDLLSAGVERVRLEIVKPNETQPSPQPEQTPTASPEAIGSYLVQVGAFQRKENAYNLKRTLDRQYASVSVIKGGSFWSRIYRVHIGPFPEQEQALHISDRLTREGYRPFITRVEE
jgi:rare lipoprotein A